MINLPAAEVVISLRDGSGSVGRVMANVGDGTSITAARGAIQTLLGPLSSLSRCAMVGYSVSYTTFISSAAGDAGQLALARGLFVFATDQEDQYLTLAVPGINPELVALDGTVDPAQPDVAAFIGQVVGQVTNPFGAVATELLASYLQIDP